YLYRNSGGAVAVGSSRVTLGSCSNQTFFIAALETSLRLCVKYRATKNAFYAKARSESQGAKQIRALPDSLFTFHYLRVPVTYQPPARLFLFLENLSECLVHLE